MFIFPLFGNNFLVLANQGIYLTIYYYYQYVKKNTNYGKGEKEEMFGYVPLLKLLTIVFYDLTKNMNLICVDITF